MAGCRKSPLTLLCSVKPTGPPEAASSSSSLYLLRCRSGVVVSTNIMVAEDGEVELSVFASRHRMMVLGLGDNHGRRNRSDRWDRTLKVRDDADVLMLL